MEKNCFPFSFNLFVWRGKGEKIRYFFISIFFSFDSYGIKNLGKASLDCFFSLVCACLTFADLIDREAKGEGRGPRTGRGGTYERGDGKGEEKEEEERGCWRERARNVRCEELENN